MIFPANCTLNGSPEPMPVAPAALRVLVLRPKEDDVRDDRLGLARLVRLKMLNISARSWRLTPSRTRVFFTSDASTVKKPGPRNALRDVVPKVPAVGFANADTV